MGAAREKVRVARALEELPKVSAAMECGKLSYSKAREITRVAHVGNEDYLLQIAEHGTAAHVERLVRAYRRCQEAEELSREQRQQDSRSVMYRYDDDGSLILTCRLPAEVGALVLKAIDLAVEGVPAGTSEERVRFSARRADALARVAESFVGHRAIEMPGTDRHQIVVHVAEETLRLGVAGCCQIEHGPSVAAETACRMACDACVVEITENSDGEPLNVGRKTRTISAPLRRLLTARDKGCRFPGCANERYVDAHHIEHWANGGETKPSNLVSLCRFHHRAVHEGGYQIERLEDGAFRFLKPDGQVLEDPAMCATPTKGDWTQLPKGSGRYEYLGDRMDLGTAVDHLIQLGKGSRYVPAGTSAS
jgi:hypothetical protein